jgi:hypothetical protein
MTVMPPVTNAGEQRSNDGTRSSDLKFSVNRQNSDGRKNLPWQRHDSSPAN